jgi:hypothetical protein
MRRTGRQGGPRRGIQQLDLARKDEGLLVAQGSNEPPKRNSRARKNIVKLMRRRRRTSGVNHPWRIDK